MNNLSKLRIVVACAGLASVAVGPLSHHAVYAQAALPTNALPPKSLLQTDDDFIKRIKPSSDQVTVARSADPAAAGIVVTIQPGNDGYPGVTIAPADGAAWDLSVFGHIELKATNTGTKSMPINLRVDDDGDWKGNPWNAENVYIKPGNSGVVTTIFGYSYGHKPAHKLKSAAVVRMLIFTGKSDVVQSFRIDSLVAAGPAGEAPAVDPASIRLKPANGFIVGPGSTLDAAKQLTASGGQATLEAAGNGQTLRAVFPAGQGNQSVTVKPAVGKWDLRDYSEVNVTVRNDGKTPVKPRAKLDTQSGASDWATATNPIAPGAQAVLTIPFSHAITPDFSNKETLGRIASDAASGVTVAVDNGVDEQTLVVQSIQGAASFAVLPEWLGKRPPVEGDWTKTLNEDFNSPTLDTTVWDNTGANYYDKATHWSKDSLLLGGGSAKLRYEKKTGTQNDDPAGKQTDYAAGYLTTYGKWVQRYGYFEGRMKLSSAPGLWPAMWLMPDRGVAAGPQWKRQDTGNGAMEMDIMEQLSRWGIHRYNIAQHWDGYGKDHKSNGTDAVYVKTDKDGYITAGLLWTPGSAIYYCNGVEVARWENPRISSVASCFLFTLPSGGWDNDRIDDKQLPADFVIDYVRAWQRKDLASAVDGKQAPAPALVPAPVPAAVLVPALKP